MRDGSAKGNGLGNALTNGDDGSPGFGIYVHWPFCAAKCPYCDFNSHVRHGGVDQSAYAHAFEREIAHMAALHDADEPVTSIFFGGGTPSLMEGGTVQRILDAIHRCWSVFDGAEITLEANPSSVDAARFAAYGAAGVNRVSLGVQSLRDDQLRFLGRLHDAAEAKRAIALARDVFPRMSFDLIYARPGQSEEDWREELGEALGLGADHLSLYQLTIEQGTPFFELRRKGQLLIPDGDRAADLYEITQQMTREAGLGTYEISNHARPGQESRHNLTYWRSGHWVGVGPGAHGRILVDGERTATATHRNPEHWFSAVGADGHGLVSSEPLTLEEQADEVLLMGLRLREGLDLARFERIASRKLDAERIEDLERYGMVERIDGGRLCATAQGAMVLDAVIADLAS